MAIFWLRLGLPDLILCRPEGYQVGSQINPLPDLAVSGVFSSGFEKFEKMTVFHIFKEKFFKADINVSL